MGGLIFSNLLFVVIVRWNTLLTHTRRPWEVTSAGIEVDEKSGEIGRMCVCGGGGLSWGRETVCVWGGGLSWGRETVCMGGGGLSWGRENVCVGGGAFLG